jgi:hypothetical protein
MSVRTVPWIFTGVTKFMSHRAHPDLRLPWLFMLPQPSSALLAWRWHGGAAV